MIFTSYISKSSSIILQDQSSKLVRIKLLSSSNGSSLSCYCLIYLQEGYCVLLVGLMYLFRKNSGSTSSCLNVILRLRHTIIGSKLAFHNSTSTHSFKVSLSLSHCIGFRLFSGFISSFANGLIVNLCKQKVLSSSCLTNDSTSISCCLNYTTFK